MSLAKYLILMISATIFCWASFLIVLYTVDPFATVTLGFVIFYASCFLAMTGTLSILGFLGRYFFKKNQFINQQVVTSFRQGILMSFLIVSSLYLQSYDLVAWWNLLILVVLLVVVEVYFLTSLSRGEPRLWSADDEGPTGLQKNNKFKPKVL